MKILRTGSNWGRRIFFTLYCYNNEAKPNENEETRDRASQHADAERTQLQCDD